MANLAVIPGIPRRSALEGFYKPGDFGTIKNDMPGIILQERRSMAIVHIDAWEENAAACAKAIEAACGCSPAPDPVHANEKEGTAVLWVGPNRWLVTESETRDLMGLLSATVGPDLATLTDQGHSRTCWRLEGPAIRDLLAKGSTIDFDRRSFRAGASIGTMLSHFAVTLHCRTKQCVDLYAARSMARDLHEWLTHSSMDLGLRIIDAG